MSFKVRKITMGKGKTTSDEKAGEWNRVYYELEAEVEDEGQVELAKGSLEALLDTWLRGETVTPEKPSWDPSKIKWTQEEGAKGPFEKSEDVNSLDFKAMLKDLQAHKGKMNREGLFYWVFENGYTVGRKKRGSAKEKPSVAGSNPTEIFPEDLRTLLSFEQKEGFCIIKPRQFLGSENFAKIASAVKKQGGDYISAGKASHFKIPLKKQET